MMLSRLFSILLVLMLYLPGQAQNFTGWRYNDRYFTVSLGAGKSAYFGDLTNGKPFINGVNNFPIALEARLTSHVGARVEIVPFRLNGTDGNAADSSFNRQRNLSYRSWNFEFNAQALIYLNPYNKIYHQRRAFEPYVAFGIGGVLFNPRVETDTATYKLREFATEDVEYSKIALVIPVGIGAKLRLNDFINLVPEASFRLTFTDYLDDVSQSFAGPFEDPVRQALSNRKDEVGIINQVAYDAMVPGGPRGDPSVNDRYLFLSLRLEVYLPPDLFKAKGSRHRKEPLLKKSVQ